MPGLDALLGKAFAKALTGDMRAAEFLIKIVANDNARRPDDGQEEAEHDAADADIIERYYERFSARSRREARMSDRNPLLRDILRSDLAAFVEKCFVSPRAGHPPIATIGMRMPSPTS